MATGDMAVDAVKHRELYWVDPIPCYERISKAHNNSTLNADERAMAVKGLKWTQPDDLPVGFNPFTFYADITQPGNGMLGLQGQVKENPETGYLEYQKCSFHCVG